MSELQHLLDEASVVDHLVARGLLPAGTPVRAEPLGGGVSNVVLAVDGYVVKQALERLRVKSDWHADPRRAIVEARALQRAAGVRAGAFPRVLDVDEDACAIVIERAPSAWREWKRELLGGAVDATVARRLGSLLGALHAATREDADVRREFGSWAGFRSRLDPFHGAVAQRHPELAQDLAALVARMRDRRRCLVHGDCSPKNVLFGPGGLWLIDFEVAHYGDPTFDVAFLVTHLIAKSVHLPDRRRELDGALRAFLAGYAAGAGDAPLVDEPAWLARQIAALLLARVDGQSPAEYLTEAEAERVRMLGARWLRTPPSRIALP